jgi:hypothetical protein
VIANSKFVPVSTSARKLEGFGARAGAFSIERDTPPTEVALLWRLQLVGKNVLIGVSRVPKSACFVECLGSFLARWQVLGFLKSLYCLSITFWIREKGGRSFAHWGAPHNLANTDLCGTDEKVPWTAKKGNIGSGSRLSDALLFLCPEARNLPT